MFNLQCPAVTPARQYGTQGHSTLGSFHPPAKPASPRSLPLLQQDNLPGEGGDKLAQQWGDDQPFPAPAQGELCHLQADPEKAGILGSRIPFLFTRVKNVIEGVRTVNKFANQSNKFCTDMEVLQKVRVAIKIHSDFC